MVTVSLATTSSCWPIQRFFGWTCSSPRDGDVGDVGVITSSPSAAGGGVAAAARSFALMTSTGRRVGGSAFFVPPPPTPFPKRFRYSVATRSAPSEPSDSRSLGKCRRPWTSRMSEARARSSDMTPSSTGDVTVEDIVVVEVAVVSWWWPWWPDAEEADRKWLVVTAGCCCWWGDMGSSEDVDDSVVRLLLT